MSFESLKKEIKNDVLRNIYLFYGPEEYLIKYYCKYIREQFFKEGLQDINYLVLEGSNATVGAIIEFCDSFPFLANKKILIVKNSNVFKTKKAKGNSESSMEILLDYFSHIPEYIHIIFVEGTELDKRNSVFNYIKNNGLVVEFQYQPKSQLIKWVSKIFKENGKTIEHELSDHLLDNLEPDMQSIYNECMKIIGFSENDIISADDINKVLTKSLNSKVFDMIDSIGQKNTEDALIKLNDMISLKEPVLKMLVLVARHIRILLQVKLALNEGMPQNIISQKLGINYIYKYIKQSENFSVSKLKQALVNCSEADIAIKTSGVDERIVLERLIVQIGE